jgi:RHS repeat-associated protein
MNLGRICAPAFSLSRRRWAISLVLLIGFASLTIINVQGQSAEFTQGNKSSSTVSLDVPLGNYPGRGIRLPVNLHYSSQGLWRIGFIKSVYANTYVGIVRQSVTEAIYAEHSTAGWTTSLDVPKVEWPKLNDRYYASGKPYANGYVGGYTFRIARVFIHMPDGSTHELRKADAVYPDNNYVDMNGTFYAVDGSRMRYDSTGETTGTLYLSDGTRYILNGSTTQCIDPNGNTLNYNAANRQWTDTLGRVISMPWPVNPGVGDYTYSLPGIAGVNGSLITYTLKFRSLSDVFLADVSGQTQKPIADRYLPNPYADPTSWNGGNFPQGPGSSYLFASAYTDPEETEQSYVHVVGRGQSGFTNFNPVVLAEIDLPNGQNYRFFYNAYGELDKVIYPTGGYQRYQYGPVSTIGFTGVPYGQASRGMLSRWISPSGSGTDEAQWTYSASAYPRVVTEPDASGSPNGTRSETDLYLPASYYDDDFGYEEALLGMPVEERIYAPASQGGAMLRRTLIEYAQSSVTINKPVQQYFPGTYTAYRNARPIKTVSLILNTSGNALVTTSTTSYDTTYQFTVGLDATSMSEYAYTTVDQITAQTGAMSSMPTGSLVRTTQTSYLTGNSNYRNRNILGLPTSTMIYNDVGIVSQSAVTYDETSFPLLTYGSVTGWTDPQTIYRGNPTTTSRWLDYPTSTWIAAHAQYDQCGSVRKTWDARDTSLLNPTQIEYSATYDYAYPTTTSSAVPDSSGVHGSTTSLVATSVYDFNTGLVTSTTDANSKTTNFEYNDSLNRPTKVSRPDGGWTSTSYGDTPGNLYVHTQTLQQSSPTQQLIEGYGYFDNLGRSVRSFAYDGTGSTPWIVVDTYYDSLGRVSNVSNPYRVSAPSGSVPLTCSTCSTTEYDSLGRVFRITTPDGAQINSAYSASIAGSYLGTTITATDQAGKARKSTTDAQGRVIQVIEDPGNLAWETNYTYDVLNNLRKVDQGGQLRYFGYDSLSRLIRVRHVEQNVNTALNWTDPVTGYAGGWTMSFSYDASGNLTSRTDARNFTTSSAYDALNRPYSRSHSDGTPTVTSNYDSATNGLGRLASVSSSVSNITYGEYDSLGRVKSGTVTIGGQAYTLSYNYDLAGHIKKITYPSGHEVNYGFDIAGRMNSFTGNLGDNLFRTYSTGISYNEFGGMQEEQFGTVTPLYHKQRYNVRGQLWDMRLSTLSFSSDPGNGDRGAIVNYYSNNFVQGGSNTTNNGSLLRQENYIPGSSYFQDNFNYDSLNRLQSISEKLNGTGTDSFKQAFSYDRWGNRTIDQSNTSPSLPLSMRSIFSASTATNRLNAPAGYSFGYDAAGNQDSDNYGDGSGTSYSRTYDAENHMIASTATYSNPYQLVNSNYVYDGLGRRIKRNIGGTETWQVYGLDGELLAEYAAYGAASSPQKEYGYRNGQLLITAEPGNAFAPLLFGDDFNDNSLNTASWSTYYPGPPNVSEQSQQLQVTLSPNTAAYNGVYSNATYDLTGRMVQVELPQAVSQAGWCENYIELELNANNYFMVQVGAGNLLMRSRVNGVNDQTSIPFDPTAHRFWRIRHDQSANLISFETSANDNVWITRKTVAPGFSLTGLRIHLLAGCYGTGNSNPGTVKYDNVKLLSSTAGSTSLTVPNAGFEAPVLGNGNWQYGPTGGSWTFANGGGISGMNSAFTGTPSSAPEGVQIAFIQATGEISQSISGFQANTNYVISFAAIQRTNCCNTGGQDIGVYVDTTQVGTFHPSSTGYLEYSTQAFTTTAGTHTLKFIGLNPLGGDHTAFIDNVRINGSAKPGYATQWLVTDQLGTPRMVVDESGGSASVKRHDYLPFGEELSANIGGRTTGQGYSGTDGVRQHFTSYELDAESGLNFAQARYQSSVQGRFTSVDPLGASAKMANPQSFNRYSYVLNSPTNLTDPSGLISNDSGTRSNGAERDDEPPGDPFERGSDIVGGAMARFDSRVADTIFANGLNSQINSGRMTRDQAEQAIKGNDNLSIESKGEPQIVFDSVELLDDPVAGFPEGPLKVPRPIRPVRSGTPNEFDPNQFTLDVDHPAVDTRGILAIRVKFHIIDGDLDTATVDTTNRDERRWRIAGQPLKVEGGIIFTANVWDKEGPNNHIYVTVRAKWKANVWDKGKLNDVRYKTARAEIILRIGPRDKR